MTMEEFWPLLSASSRDWLLANAGDAVPQEIAVEIDDLVESTGADDVWETPAPDAVGAPPTDDEEEEADDEDRGEPRYLADSAVDWIEARANDE